MFPQVGLINHFGGGVKSLEEEVNLKTLVCWLQQRLVGSEHRLLRPGIKPVLRLTRWLTTTCNSNVRGVAASVYFHGHQT